MKKFKISLCFIIPIILIAIISIAVIPSGTISRSRELRQQMQSNKDSTESEQIVYAASLSGASDADASEKGGAYYLKEGTTLTISGGTINSKVKKYGGAIYVSKNATLTINSGTIKNCKAKYGGAIYIEKGGEVFLNGGSIEGNIGEVAPAVYVENGGKLHIKSANIIKTNFEQSWHYVEYSNIEKVGGVISGANNSNLSLRTIEFGSFPQSYVGDLKQIELNSWLNNRKPAIEYVYTFGHSSSSTLVFLVYRYLDGNLYARGKVKYENPTYNMIPRNYENGDIKKPSNSYVWFKVEPIKWYITNLDYLQSGKLELMSQKALFANLYYGNSQAVWKDSSIREFLNAQFYQNAFSNIEKEMIINGEVKNNSKGVQAFNGISTYDYVYIPSYVSMNSNFLRSDSSKLCSPTDLAVCTGAEVYRIQDVFSLARHDGATTKYYLRETGNVHNTTVMVVGLDGLVDKNNFKQDANCAIRPCITISIKD